MQRQSVSCSIVVFNEEQQIRECLETAKWMDEIIIVDAYSTDQTKKYGSNIRIMFFNENGMVLENKKILLSNKPQVIGCLFWMPMKELLLNCVMKLKTY